MDGHRIYFSDQHLVNNNVDNFGHEDEQSLLDAELKFMHFIREWKKNNTYIYRE